MVHGAKDKDKDKDKDKGQGYFRGALDMQLDH